MTASGIDHGSASPAHRIDYVDFCMWNILPFLKERLTKFVDVSGELGRRLSRLSRLSQTCSMGLRSGLLAGQSYHNIRNRGKKCGSG